MLEKLPPVTDPRALVSSNTVDDAGVYLLNDDTAVVFTVDFFTPVVDDPRDYGRIAAANSLSDVYAMGGTPLIALNLVCFPDGDLPSSVMAEMLLGGDEKAREAGVVILGGHSVSDRELKYGLAVVGRVNRERVVTNSGARPGDVLALTKPIGTGVLATALKDEALGPEELRGVTEVMTALNRVASEAMTAAGATAATDVTGFGLVGHAVEMANGSAATLEIVLGDVPLIPGARRALEDEHVPGGLFTNQHYYSRFVGQAAGADRSLADIVYDPQTSGGLLVALPEDAVDAFVSAVRAGGGSSWVVGRVVARGEHAVALL